MKLLLGISMLLLSLGAVHAIPVRAPATPVPPAPPKIVQLDLRGTTWSGTLFGPDAHITFEIDGTITYRRGPRGVNGPVLGNGTWALTGTQLYFEVANKASEHRGTVNGNLMTGESTNKLQNLRAELRLQRGVAN